MVMAAWGQGPQQCWLLASHYRLHVRLWLTCKQSPLCILRGDMCRWPSRQLRQDTEYLPPCSLVGIIGWQLCSIEPQLFPGSLYIHSLLSRPRNASYPQALPMLYILPAGSLLTEDVSMTINPTEPCFCRKALSILHPYKQSRCCLHTRMEGKEKS